MDIQRIADYMDAVDIKHCGTNILSCLRKKQWLQEYGEMVRAKRKDFDACILEWCMEYGANATRSLVVYKEELEKNQKGYRHEKKLFASLINSNGELLKPLLTSPFDEVPVQIEMPNDKDNATIKNFFNAMLLELGDAIRYIDKMMDIYSHNTTDTNDDATANVHYTTTFSNKELKRVYKYLIGNGHLDADNLLSDFIHFFTGRGKKVNDCLKWKSSKVGLAYFIDAIIVKGGTKDKQFWKKAETIFRESNLANKYSQSVKNKDNSQNEKIANDIKRLLKIK